MTIDIEVNLNWVLIEKTRIERPARISPDQWLDMWLDFRDTFGYNLSEPPKDLII